MNDWITFGEKLPNIGDNIELKFDNNELWAHNPYGKISKIIDTRNLGSESCIVSDIWNKETKAWSLCSDKYVNSVVKSNYFWRKTNE